MAPGPTKGVGGNEFPISDETDLGYSCPPSDQAGRVASPPPQHLLFQRLLLFPRKSGVPLPSTVLLLSLLSQSLTSACWWPTSQPCTRFFLARRPPPRALARPGSLSHLLTNLCWRLSYQLPHSFSWLKRSSGLRGPVRPVLSCVQACEDPSSPGFAFFPMQGNI